MAVYFKGKYKWNLGKRRFKCFLSWVLKERKRMTKKKQLELIWKLAKNDFKNRFSGSAFGIVWAFAHPVVTVLLYWLVFDKVMGAKAALLKSGIDAPYVIWLTAGLVPWFYFSEALNNGTTSLMEYSYLVKKVVFKIEVIPMIKIVAALFTHLFFVVFMMFMHVILGGSIDIYFIQLIYYSFALVLFVLALSYFTSAVAVFFKDLLQIINIGLQVGMWATPILWNFSNISEHPVVIFILKLNPIYYIVNGYRSAMFEDKWFWQEPGLTVYFWAVTAILFLVNKRVFNKLRIHFADVL